MEWYVRISGDFVGVFLATCTMSCLFALDCLKQRLIFTLKKCKQEGFFFGEYNGMSWGFFYCLIGVSKSFFDW